MYGYLRETKEQALKAGLDPVTGICRTGLDEYLNVIFPKVDDWIHDKAFGEHYGVHYKIRPDYRSDSLMLIVEFDGLPHYQNPDVILKDKTNTAIYESYGYKVVRIPYFIQLTSEVVKQLFNRNVDGLFDGSKPSLNIESRCTPAYLCHMGVERMKQEFKKFPEQYKVNVDYLRSLNQPELTGVNLI